MVAVRVNGEDSQVSTNPGLKIADLVELIKATIDPDHMITAIQLDGRELEDDEWAAPLSRYETNILEVYSGPPEQFVTERLEKSSEIVRECYLQFRDSRKTFQQGRMVEGNQQLVRAVGTLKMFFEWYGTLLELCGEERKKEIDISKHVTEISDICKRVCQQQLYQSWWALGETIQKELEPKLDELEDFFRKFRSETVN